MASARKKLMEDERRRRGLQSTRQTGSLMGGSQSGNSQYLG